MRADAGRGAALFHATLVAALADWVARAARAQRIAHRGLRRRLLPQCPAGRRAAA